VWTPELYRLTLAEREALRMGGLALLDEALNLFLARGLAREPSLKRLGRGRDVAGFLDRQRIIAGGRAILGRHGKLFAMIQ
jgi:hypothetical protein